MRDVVLQCLGKAQPYEYRWLLIGAVLVGIPIVVYVIFFCAEECH